MTTGAELSPSSSALTAGIMAYVGKGRVKIPTADEPAVRMIDPAHGDELLSAVRDAIADSDAIELADADAVDGSLREPFVAQLTAVRPDLEPIAVDALGWRWAFLRFHG